MILKKCRVCNSEKLIKVFSLGYQPLANNLEDKVTNSKKYPLEINLCKNCSNCQLTVTISSKKLLTNTCTNHPCLSYLLIIFLKLQKNILKISN